MKINLKNTPIYWINLEKDLKKKKFQEEQFLKYELDKNYRIDAIEVFNHSHNLNCKEYLSYLISLYKIRNRLPALILEDDVVIIKENFKYALNVPKDIDALYLGHSIWGLGKQKNGDYPNLYEDHPYVRPGISPSNSLGATVFTKYNKYLSRTHNMLATHAILYVSKKYVESLIKTLEKYIFKKCSLDMITAVIQNNFKILTTNKPYFYQKNFDNKKNEKYIEYYTVNPKANDGNIIIRSEY